MATTTKDLLSMHETVAEFSGLEEQKCIHLTSLCPDKCSHGGTTAIFTILKYLKYAKPGKYGDEKSDKYYNRITDSVETSGLKPDFKIVLDSLKDGDCVLLSWDHFYVHKEGCSFPERPISKLEKISREEANKL